MKKIVTLTTLLILCISTNSYAGRLPTKCIKVVSFDTYWGTQDKFVGIGELQNKCTKPANVKIQIISRKKMEK